MKRTIVCIISVLLLITASLGASAEELIQAAECEVDSNGNLTAYLGEYSNSIYISSNINGKNVKSLSTGLFKNKPIYTVYLEDGIEEIGASCFEASTLYYIDIPESVKRIEKDAFKDCTELTSLVLGSDATEFESGAFSGTGYLYFAVPCTSDIPKLQKSISAAKGNSDFSFDIMHTALVPSMEEKDIYGNPLLICESCGYAEKGYDDIDIPFDDVPKDAWYYPYVLTAYECSILNGKSANKFDPGAYMTLAEAAKIAACINVNETDAIYDFTPSEGEAWYQPYVNYCYENKIIDEHVVFDWGKNSSRAEMAYLFSRADVSDFELNPDVPLTDIPDVDEKTSFSENILALYRRGIATGSDEFYTFYPDAYVKRSEAAAFISRILRFDMRTELAKG